MPARTATKPQTQPELWQNLINASLDEGFISGGLEQLQNLLVSGVVPSIQHIQLLVYLALHPTVENPNAQHTRSSKASSSAVTKRETESHQLQALLLLNQLLSTVKPVALAGAFPNAFNSTSCVSYQPHGELQKAVKDAFVGHEGGVWDMLLTRRQSDLPEYDDDEEDDRVVDEDAWELVEWLVKWWEADQANYPEDPHSPLFLRQLPPGLETHPSSTLASIFSEQYDCSMPFLVIKSAFTPNDEADVAELIRRRDVAIRLLQLLLSATITQPKAHFSPPALQRAIHLLFRQLSSSGAPISSLERYLASFRSLPWIFVADSLATFLDSQSTSSLDAKIERSSSQAFRKLGKGRQQGPYSTPTASQFLLNILPLQPATCTKLAFNTIKLSLFTLLKVHLAADEWSKVDPDDGWQERVNLAFLPQNPGEENAMAMLQSAIETLLSSLRPEPLDLETELALIESSLLSEESLRVEMMSAFQAELVITSTDSDFDIRVEVRGGYPSKGTVIFQVCREGMGRDEQSGWLQWTRERMDFWDDAVETEYPIYHLLTEHFLPLLAKGEPEASEHLSRSSSNQKSTDTLHHILFTSHHLIAPSKRKDLKGLSSSLNLKGFGKIGHPGIIFAEGSHADLEEFVKEVKSWQWLALRLRVFEEDTDGKPRGTGRGEWTELEKLGEAVEWLRSVGKERLLLDIGMGSGANTR